MGEIKLLAKKTFLEKIKARYDSQSAQAIHLKAVKLKEKIVADGSKLIERLFYLMKTGRFREIKGFKEKTFDQYLKIVYGFGRYVYENMEIAYLQYPEETKRLGVGTVARVFREVGSARALEVLKEIPDNDFETVNQIIEKYSHKDGKNRTEKISYIELEAINTRQREEIRKLKSENIELSNQVAKLKITVETLRLLSKEMENEEA